MKHKNNKSILFSTIIAFLSCFVFSLSACDESSVPPISSESESNELVESVEEESNESIESEESLESESFPEESSENSEESSEESSESIEESEEPTPEHITLQTPTLSLDSDTGLVTWDLIEHAEYYRYYINEGDIHSLTTNSVQLESGETISVIAESDLEHVSSSSWSKPVTYFDLSKDVTNITIAFQNTTLPSVEIQSGSTYNLPTPNQKENYTFEGWYLDPFYKQNVPNDHIYNKDTVVYANYVENDWVKGASYWIKANSLITSTLMSSSEGWKFIPLSLDMDETAAKGGKLCFSSLVTVSGATTSTPAAFLVMDGTKDDASRTYYKNGDSDYSIESDGTYRIYFSVEHAWENAGQKRNCHIEQVSTQTTSTYTERNLPLGVLNSSTELDRVSLRFSEDNETVTWNPINHATGYEYIIDNGEIQTTTSNSVILYEGSFITVRAITTESGYLSSRWSLPLYHETPSYPDSISLYFYGLDRGSQLVEYGTKATRPSNDPVKPGYRFLDWYKDISLRQVFDFDEPLYKNTVIYAGFEYIDTVLYTLYKADKTSVIGDLEVSEQYSYNEYKINFKTESSNEQVYVKDNSSNEYYGPYQMGAVGTYNLYFSSDHLWDIETENERNAYWSMETNKIYFTNNKSWGSVYIYTWNSNGYYKAWPGETMTYYRTNSYGEDLYEYVLPSGYTNIVFSNGSGTQTVDIDLTDYPNKNAFYPESKGSDGKYTVGAWQENA